MVQPSGEREPGIEPERRSTATAADIELASPAFAAIGGRGAALPATYTCDGGNAWPALQWSRVPSEAEELTLLVASVQPVQGQLFFNWAVAGLDPELDEIPSGRLPRGAVVGRNGYGKATYSICPSRGSSESYIFMLYAYPDALQPRSGFDPLELREAILDQAGHVGLLGASYQREP